MLSTRERRRGTIWGGKRQWGEPGYGKRETAAALGEPFTGPVDIGGWPGGVSPFTLNGEP
jgi:hypothetical protein